MVPRPRSTSLATMMSWPGKGWQRLEHSEPLLVEVFLDLSDGDVYRFLRVGTMRSSKEDANVVGKLVCQFGLCKGVQ